MRIGIFGGTFDPVHNGHLEIAEKVWQWFALDRLYFIPAAQSPHKHRQPEAPAWDRFAMLVLATQPYAAFYVSTLELARGGVSYTIDTVRELRHRMGEDAELYFIMGADAFQGLTQWKEYDQLLRLMNLVVIPRPGYILSAEGLPEEIRARVRAFVPERDRVEEQGPRIYFCSGIHNATSATAIRAALRRGEAIAHLVPSEAAAYIEKYRLYREGVTT
ncbi:putative nicotinate-nucleotide adenylyltransferase [bacterium HR10]|nr:putative nicotinate-nucleotide adenylyltransferase [bacterium HR10]